jgi:hypothetical protein
LGEPKSLCVKISILQAIKNVHVHNKFIKEECLKKPGRKEKDSPTFNVIGQLTNLMLGRVFVPKYLDLGNPIMDVHINKCLIQNTLIDLGVAINVMTRDTMLRLSLQGLLRLIPILLQLKHISTMNLEGVLEDVMVSIDS